MAKQPAIPNCATCRHCTHDDAGGMVCIHTTSMYHANTDYLNAKLHTMQFHSTAWMREEGRPCGKDGTLYAVAQD